MNTKSIAAVALLSVVAANAATYESATFDYACKDAEIQTYTVSFNSECVAICGSSVQVDSNLDGTFWVASSTCGVTEAPTEAPTTAEPTTEAPTTAEPTTEAPTTAEPTTEAPTTAEPTTEAPTTEAPTTPASLVADTEAPTETFKVDCSSSTLGLPAAVFEGVTNAKCNEGNGNSAASIVASFALVAASVVAALL